MASARPSDRSEDIERFRVVNRRHFILSGTLAAISGECLAADARAAPGKQPLILVVGDSLSAEYGLKRGEGWVPLLDKRLGEQKVPATVVNASISGDTTSGGRARLPNLLAQHKPTHVVLELGGNDALRGLPLASTEDNLLQMTKAAQSAGAQVLLVGIQVPPNYGSDYTRRFEAIFAKVAAATKTPVVPFLLKGIADGPDAAALFQADRIHPTAAAQPRMLDNVWPTLRKMLPK
ncbi:arylesterase [Variovorax saccharolyticus]|uniref:arylesterase n=1 Tax=Variovorax saccharolyticus TaxID=3053516 RepID=UPI0025769EA1|nr:arylesterase [Variovorax sp. J22R187]MDM0020359.1 arylesterase [Variovorax sp. J22R187]